AQYDDQPSRLHAAAARRARRGEAARRLTGARALAGDRAGAHRRHRRLLPAPAAGEWARRAAGRDQDVRARHPRRADAHDVAASGGGDAVILLRSDGARIFVTALLVYAVFWNPWLQFSNSDNFVDAAVSLVDTGRWSLTRWPLYEGKDTATARDGRIVPGVPFGTALAIAPLYAVWRAAGGAPVDGWSGLEAVNAVAILLLCAPAMALTAVQVAWLAGWVGATRRGRLLAALLFGAPWRTSYSAITGLSTRFAAPKAAIVADFVVGPRGGLFLYSPFLLAAPSGLAAAWRGVRRAEAALTVAFLLLLTLVGASW